MSVALLTEERQRFHRRLVEDGTLVFNAAGAASNADAGQKSSLVVARSIANELGARTASQKLTGQQMGRQFEDAVRWFLNDTFPQFAAVRPGRWSVENVGGSRAEYHLARYEPYTHLAALAAEVQRSPTLASVLGNSYEISPDVIVVRHPCPDAELNQEADLVDDEAGTLSPLRSGNGGHGIVHAVISCKWTLRSDRAQNARSEALNIIRNRKGRTPHIVVVTAEPSPSRISSLALGTGDVDTVYHFALPELVRAIEAEASPGSRRMLTNLVSGQRLRDIADLPLDLCV